MYCTYVCLFILVYVALIFHDPLDTISMICVRCSHVALMIMIYDYVRYTGLKRSSATTCIGAQCINLRYFF